MFTIIQSHRTENLVDQLLVQYQSKDQPVFEPFIVIVPSMVLGDWLDKTIASRAGISTLVRTKFWGQYQWTLMQDVLTRHNAYLLAQNPEATTLNVPEVAVLSPTVMQWRLFGYLTYYQESIVADEKHPVHPLLASLIDDPQATAQQDSLQQDKAQQDARIWQLASDLARVFNRYLTHREDWLALWSQNKPLSVSELIADKDALSLRFDKYARGTPEWLVEHYVELEVAQRFLWSHLFADVHLHRVALERAFWSALKGNKANERDQLPKVLRIFTIQQLPQTELDFLQSLSQYMNITLLHYNPSKLFWADIVDKSWLQRQQIINPESVFLRDYGHSLLSRLGKQSRDAFAMLANLSGNEQYDDALVEWQDNFDKGVDNVLGHYDYESIDAADDAVSTQDTQGNLSLLKRLQNDVLMLDEQSTQQATAATVSQAVSKQLEPSFDEDKPETAWYEDEALENKRFEKDRFWAISSQDNSLSIHSCHSLQRQLEVLRIMIGRWLNEPIKSGEKKRHISDIVVLLPDVERHHALIGSIFVNGKGQDGLTLPAKVTGVVDADIRQLWEAIIGFYKLLGSHSARFEAAEVLDWLMLPPLFESFGLTHEQMSRGCDLLVEAGFIRGFDELHLKQTLDSNDYDYRFSFAQALDRLTLGLVMPEAELSDCLYPLNEDEWPSTALPEMTLPLPQVSLNDALIVEALCRIYTGLVARRDDHTQKMKAEDWLDQIETQVIHRYFGDVDQTRTMRAIYNAMNGFKSSLRANRHYRQYASGDVDNREVEQRLAGVEQLPLKLSFMLDSIENELESQQVSAEPTGVITFGRFGALRNVPFELVVMLNMDLSEFPGRDRDNRYDLMKATNARRGDRVSEDDDNGAFLDALLCARSACWMFYNGQSLTDTHEHLPANPVSELLQFLQGEVQWQVNSLETLPENIDPTTESLKRYLPKLIKQWLVTEHPALPFHESLFETEIEGTDIDDNANANININAQDSSPVDMIDELDTLLNTAMRKTKLAQKKQFPPAPLWQAVFDTLKGRVSSEHKELVGLPTKAQYESIAQVLGQGLGQLGQVDNQTLSSLVELLALDTALDAPSDVSGMTEVLSDSIFNIGEIDIEGALAYQVRHPAKAFLRSQKVHVVQGEEALSHQEPLFLDSLTTYQIKDHLIKQLVTDENKKNGSDAANETTTPILMYQKIMPAGVARQTTLPNQQKKLQQQCLEFKEQLIANGFDESSILNESKADSSSVLQLLSPTAEHPVQIELKNILSSTDNESSNQTNIEDIETLLKLLPKIIKIKGSVPVVAPISIIQAGMPYAQQSPKQWLNILPNSASPRHLLKFWLSHLYWQVARRTTAEQVALNDGVSIWRFNKSNSQVKKYDKVIAFKLSPIVYEDAVIELIKWAIFGKLTGQVPITLLPEYALNYLDKYLKPEEGVIYWPKRSDFKGWLRSDDHLDTVYDTCSQHAIWQYVLRDQDAFKALSAALTTLAQPLYEPMFNALTKLDG
ncbi:MULTISPECIES: exodeoxyribonuclease V subunit gamma [Psychrobacter]|uniref:exodeoxyribonuclease V subunit gamma n=1 Tax=Psychrobacter TaxID=497 RepID=UPI000C33FB48|nr:MULTISPECIES: exodeoxyribonuclease V subunit gamma [Psychrobacter]MBA6244823.1 exodeoxyribonuclease V subunit gamma [Psychrobacter sp. Urea-trap-18]MBA6285321.1 exodeoxyribonuclease V subunit gamma [Psychrobacter sp. Urea-trap-16]MBA6318111.1 exodeoxyribonuclease V subunit gamma [Psychrobacter sp. Urea-trap-20]MBA6333602.1 exodeoxyribonuclease V subunit gamma [Psychrobacter sp. Urea-trap-19]PKG59953.1 exodeoxyribonuclease V subunit gamma [Psychrobacter sp. Choline-3u-12]